MTSCELCGKITDLVFAFVEGVKLKVCPNCSKFGKVVTGNFNANSVEKKVVRRKEIIEIVRKDCGKIVKNFRESKGMSQKDLALIVKEKESVIAKIEQGGLIPNVDLARRLEKFIDIQLVSRENDDIPVVKTNNSASLTIGDILKK